MVSNQQIVEILKEHNLGFKEFYTKIFFLHFEKKNFK